MSERLRVLVSAYACEPDKGSEPGIGWNWVQQIARFHDVWVITRANNRQVIEAALQQNPLPNVTWIYFDLPRWSRFWKKWPGGVYLYYTLWQFGIYFVARKFHRRASFDLAHHVTFVNYWLPTFLFLLPVPFIWGPVGGGDTIPPAFYRSFNRRGQVYERLRVLVRWASELNPIVRLTARRARIALATTPEMALRLRRLGAQRVELMSQVAIAENEYEYLSQMPQRQSDSLRLLSMGQMAQLKGFHMGLRVFAQLLHEHPDAEYWLVGDGHDRAWLERLADELGISHRVRFWGSLSRQEALARLAECDMLVHPSLRDSGGMVCAEAMAAGRPVMCLDLAGPAMQVTPETGVKIAASTPEQAVADMAAAMLSIARDRDRLARMSEAARQRVAHEFLWTAKGNAIDELYTRILNKTVK